MPFMLQCAQMSPDNFGDDNARKWAQEAGKILDDPVKVFKLIFRRIEILKACLIEPLSREENATRVAVVGYPNRGKTTFAYSVAQILDGLGFPANYVDLDIYTQSGLAMSGEVSWSNRPKNDFKKNPSQEMQNQNRVLKSYTETKPGIVIGDCPGRIDNPSNKLFLKNSDFAVILCANLTEMNAWAKLCSEAGVGHFWLISKPKIDMNPPIYPQISKLNRQTKLDYQTMIAATDLLFLFADIRNIQVPEYENFFTNPELVVLEEHLDFLFSMRNVN